MCLIKQVELSLLVIKLFFPHCIPLDKFRNECLTSGRAITKAHNSLVPMDSAGLESEWNLLLSNIGEDSQVFWEGKDSWVWFLCSLGSYPRSSGNGTLTIPSYIDNYFSSFSSFHAMFSALPSPFLSSVWMLNARKAEKPKPKPAMFPRNCCILCGWKGSTALSCECTCSILPCLKE